MAEPFKIIMTITPDSNKRPHLEFEPASIGKKPSKEILFECIQAFLAVSGDMVGWLASVYHDTEQEQENTIQKLTGEFAKQVREGRKSWDKKGKVSTAIH